MGLIQMIHNPFDLLLAAAAWGLIQTFSRCFPGVTKTRVYARLLPVLPIAVCLVLVWFPGSIGAETIGQKIVLGIVLGMIAGQSHKIGGQTVLGRDKRLTE